MTSKKILIIEDEPDQLFILREQISGKGYDYIEAGDGEEGLQRAVSDLPDLIVTDVIMPKMNGFEVCKAIKENPETSHIPVIIVSASAMKGFEEICMGSGADSYLKRPYDSNEFYELLKKYLD